MVCFLGTLLYSCASCFSKIQSPEWTNLAGSLDGAPIHRHFTNSKAKTLSRDPSILQHFIHTTGIRCSISIHKLQCDCDCDLRAPCAAAVRSHNTPLQYCPKEKRMQVADQSKQLCLTTSSDKRQLTATPCVSGSGEVVCMQIITRGKTERSQADVPPDCLLHDAMSQDHSEKKVQTGATFERLLRKLADKANHIRERHQLQENSPVIIMHAVAFPEPRNPHSDQRTSASMQGPPFAVHLYWRKETLARLKLARPVDQSFNEEIRQVVAARQDGETPHENPQERDPEQNTT